MPRAARRHSDPFAALSPIMVSSPGLHREPSIPVRASGHAKRQTKAGTRDRRFGPRILADYRAATPLSLQDYAIGQQHAADMEDAGMPVSLEPCTTDDAEAWRITDPEAGVSHYVWRRGRRYGVKFRTGDGSDAGGFDSVRMFPTIDAAFNRVRLRCGIPEADHAAEATAAALTLAALPAWLRTDAA